MGKNKKKITTIGCASGFWGDSTIAASQLVSTQKLDYLMFDYLAEITMSILAKSWLKNPEMGYVIDFIQVLTPLLGEIQRQRVKVICNAGGINPLGCQNALQKVAEQAGVDLKIAVVTGDNLMSQQNMIRTLEVQEIDTGKPLPEQLVSLNAYLGALPIVKALEAGADVVITGRCVDSALVLGPLMYEFQWTTNDHDQLAAGSLAGHIIECGTQCTGGNFTDWESVSGYDQIGFPMIECLEDGSFTVTKPQNTGGLVSPATVGEQFLYELGDPGAYILPDVTCDFTQVTLQEVGENRVLVQGAKGYAPSSSYKVCATYLDGYRVDTVFMLAGIDALQKGKRVAESILKKTRRLLAKQGWPDYTDTQIALLGNESTYGPHSRQIESREAVIKITVCHPVKQALQLFAKEIAHAATGTTPGVIGMLGGRPVPSPIIPLYSFLLPKEQVDITVILGEQTLPINIPIGKNLARPLSSPLEIPPISSSLPNTVPLIKLAWARSGDKGDHANIGVIARKASYLPFIYNALTEEAVTEYFAHLLKGTVTRWRVPGVHGMNFLLRHVLGGGGIASIRLDPQGKAFAQMLLEYPISISDELEEELNNG